MAICTEIGLEKKLAHFSPDDFVARSVRHLAQEMASGGFRGTIVGASGGIDSLVTAALCVRASEQSHPCRAVALQMNDSRVKGESYNPEMYRSLGADLIQTDITSVAMDMERHLGLPPRWLTLCLMKLVLRCVPARVRRRVILAVKAGEVPRWVHAHYELLILLHRLRIARLREYATCYQLLLLIAANLTEASLGYFVEGGIDDPRMGDCAPLSELYKSQVIRVAQFMGLPEQVLRQRPSPGFGGIYDEEIIGRYELADLVLVGLRLGYSDAEIIQALRVHAYEGKERGLFMRNASYDIDYVRFLRRLVQLNAQKEYSHNRKWETG